MTELKAVHNPAAYINMYIVVDYPLLVKKNDGIHVYGVEEKCYPEVEYTTEPIEILTTIFDSSRSKKMGITKQYIRDYIDNEEDGYFKYKTVVYD